MHSQGANLKPRGTWISQLVAVAVALLPGACARADEGVTPLSGVRQVIVVFKTHFDIGFTDMASNVVQRYRTSMIDQALQVVDQNRDLPPSQQFVWTIPGWPLHKILEDWPGQRPERQQRVAQAFKEGRFVVHALPFSTHTELLEAEDLVRGLGYSSRLTRGLGLELPRDAKMTDVPEHTWMLATLLHHAGVDFMVIGCNGRSGPLRVPPLFWWEGPDGSRVLTMYSTKYGTQLMPPKDWPYHTWLALLNTGDNHGPPKPEEVKQLLGQAAKELPGVEVRIGRMSDFADAVLAEKPALPVVRGDAPDTWIHGPMSDPAGARIARNTRPLITLTESLNTQLRAWGLEVPAATPAVTAAYEQSLLYGEHTWGGSIGWIGRKLSYGEDFRQDRAKGRFQRIEGSWDEHTGYIEAARNLITPVLEQNLQALAQAVSARGRRIVVYNPLPWKRDGLASVGWDGPAVAALKLVDGDEVLPVERASGQLHFIAHDLPPMGYRTYVPAKINKAESIHEVVAADGSWRTSPRSERSASTAVGGYDAKTATAESPFFKATLDPARGVVRSLVDKRSGYELVDAGSPIGLGQYLYERFDHNQVRSYCETYLRGGGEPAHFAKPGLPSAEQCPYQAFSPTDFKLRFEQSPVSVTAVMEAQGGTNLPPITTRLVLYGSLPYADLEITLHDKPLEPWPEAGWLCLPFKVSEPQFHLGRLGSIIDPARDCIAGANRNIFGLNSGLTMTDPQGRGVGFCPLDAPLVSLDEPGCWKYSLDFVPRKPVAYLNLFNNQWTTNFRFWNRGTWTYRVRLWAIDGYAAEPALITPAEEARFPVQAAAANGRPGKLPPAQRGLEISGKGVLVTAFGANPDGEGMVLRLWEYAGMTAPREARLPEGIKASSVQPVNLRGQPLGKAIPVHDRRFSFDLGAFAPASFLMAAQPASRKPVAD